MEFFTQAVNILKILVIALGAGLGVWGLINLLEGYGNDNPGAKSQGMKQVVIVISVVDLKKLKNRKNCLLIAVINACSNFAYEAVMNFYRHYLLLVFDSFFVNNNFFNKRIKQNLVKFGYRTVLFD